MTSVSVGWVLFWGRQHDLAIEQARRTLAMDPHSPQAYFVLGLTYLNMSRFDEAIDALQQAKNLGGGVFALAFLASAYAMAGRLGLAQSCFHELQEKQCDAPLLCGWYYAAAGEMDKAFECFEKSYQERDGRLFWLKVSPQYEFLRSDPRFHELLRRIGLKP
jgi:tetratricopeptide (TPR) repeat protein